jgi:hypothetical protein
MTWSAPDTLSSIRRTSPLPLDPLLQLRLPSNPTRQTAAAHFARVIRTAPFGFVPLLGRTAENTRRTRKAQ